MQLKFFRQGAHNRPDWCPSCLYIPWQDGDWAAIIAWQAGGQAGPLAVKTVPEWKRETGDEGAWLKEAGDEGTLLREIGNDLWLRKQTASPGCSPYPDQMLILPKQPDRNGQAGVLTLCVALAF